MLRVRETLERFSELTGSAVAWLTILMVLGTFVIVVLRYGFDLGWIAMQESITWMHAAVFMLGTAYTLKRDEHVRVDIFYRGMSVRYRAAVNLAGTAVFLLPMTVFLAISSWDYVWTSWAIREASREAGGLPHAALAGVRAAAGAGHGERRELRRLRDRRDVRGRERLHQRGLLRRRLRGAEL